MDGVIETVDLGVCLELFERDDGLEGMLRCVRGRLRELSSCTRTGGGGTSCDIRNKNDDLSASEDSESSEDHCEEEEEKDTGS